MVITSNLKPDLNLILLGNIDEAWKSIKYFKFNLSRWYISRSYSTCLLVVSHLSSPVMAWVGLGLHRCLREAINVDIVVHWLALESIADTVLQEISM